jgi:hypothetical protein
MARQFEDTKRVIRNRKLKKVRQYNGEKKKKKRKICNTLHRKPNVEQHEIMLFVKVKP